MTNEEIQSFKNKCINEYPAIVRFVAIHYTSDQQISSKFKKQRRKLHVKLENNLRRYQLEITSNISTLKDSLVRNSSRPVPTFGPIYSSEHGMMSRKLIFLQQMAHNLKSQINTHKIDRGFSLLNSIEQFFKLIEETPEFIMLNILQAFFDLKDEDFPVSNPGDTFLFDLIDPNQKVFARSNGILYSNSNPLKISDYEKYYTRVSAYCSLLSNRIQTEIQPPLWATNYPLFLRNSVRHCIQFFDEDLSYILHQELEIDLSRFFFDKCSPYLLQIDAILRSINKISPEIFILELVGLCNKLMPNDFYEEVSQNEYLIALTFLFRALYNRLYELFERNWINNFRKPSEIPFITLLSDKNDKDLFESSIKNNIRYHTLKDLKMSAFTWPLSYLSPHTPNKNVQNSSIQQNHVETTQNNDNSIPLSNTQNPEIYNEMPSTQNSEDTNQEVIPNNIENNENPTRELSQDSLNMTIEEYFNNDNLYRPAIEFLELVMFHTNPLDILYYIHKFLASTQKAAILYSAADQTEITQTQLNRIICFDDSFLLSLAGFISADLPDLFSLNWFVKTFSPDGLSPAIDHAKSNLEAITQHIATAEISQL